MWYTRLLTAPEESIAANWRTYGIDCDGPLTDIETDNNVVVPESLIQLTDHQLQELQNRIDPLFDDGNNGNNHFLRHCDNHGRFHKAVMRNMFQLLNKSMFTLPVMVMEEAERMITVVLHMCFTRMVILLQILFS